MMCSEMEMRGRDIALLVECLPSGLETLIIALTRRGGTHLQSQHSGGRDECPEIDSSNGRSPFWIRLRYTLGKQ